MALSNTQKGSKNAVSEDKLQEIAETKKKQRNSFSIEKQCTARKSEVSEIVRNFRFMVR